MLVRCALCVGVCGDLDGHRRRGPRCLCQFGLRFVARVCFGGHSIGRGVRLVSHGSSERGKAACVFVFLVRATAHIRGGGRANFSL